MPIQTALRWFYVTPVSLLVAYFVSSHANLGTWTSSAPWGVAGALMVMSYKQMFRSLQDAQSKTISIDTKVFNEQVKLLATTINYVALGLFAGALLRPLSLDGADYGLQNIMLFLLAICVHLVSQKVLFAMKRE